MAIDQPNSLNTSTARKVSCSTSSIESDSTIQDLPDIKYQGEEQIQKI